MTSQSELAQSWADWCRRHDRPYSADDFVSLHRREDFRLLSSIEGTLPRLEHSTYDFLYARGDVDLLARRPRVAIVGSRQAGVEGARLAEWIAKEVVLAGAVVCSGGAIGTDTIAHEAAVTRGQPTICVLPAGIDVATPRRNRDLFERIVVHGCLISAYPPGVTARPYHYHDRNSLLVDLSDLVVVVRARQKSGSRITGEAALKQGKPLFVVPGSPDDPHSAGCLDLLEKGARILRSVEDLGLARVGSGDEAGEASPVLETLSNNGRLVVLALANAGGTGTPDQIAEAVGLSSSVVAGELVELELFGHCSRRPGGTTVALSDRVQRAIGDDALR